MSLCVGNTHSRPTLQAGGPRPAFSSLRAVSGCTRISAAASVNPSVVVRGMLASSSRAFSIEYSTRSCMSHNLHMRNSRLAKRDAVRRLCPIGFEK
jgi:hypothetical protein